MPRNRKRKAISRRISSFNKRFKPGAKYRMGRKSSNRKRFVRARFRRAVMSVVNRNAEVKECLIQVAGNTTLLHNAVTNLDNNVFKTTRGTGGEGSPDQALRIGNKIFVKRLRMSIMIESQQYRPLATYWLYLVRLKGAAMDTSVTTKAQMFEGTSNAIPMDFIDHSKCDILYCKKFRLTMPNHGTLATVGAGSTGGFPPGAEAAGTHVASGQSNLRITNPQVIRKFNVPINTTILYRDTQDAASDTPYSYRYQWVMIAYDNNTSQTSSTWPVGHVTLTQKMSFTDV